MAILNVRHMTSYRYRRSLRFGDLIRVAVTRDIKRAVPISGSFVGVPDD
jgi:hypothetical protein